MFREKLFGVVPQERLATIFPEGVAQRRNTVGHAHTSPLGVFRDANGRLVGGGLAVVTLSGFQRDNPSTQLSRRQEGMAGGDCGELSLHLEQKGALGASC